MNVQTIQGENVNQTIQGGGTTTSRTSENAISQTGQGSENAISQTGQGSENAISQIGKGIGVAASQTDMQRPQSINMGMSVFVGLYALIWLFVSMFMYRFGPSSSCSLYLFVLVNIGICICFLLCIFYSPWNHSLHKKLSKSKQKYESIKKDTEPIYQQQIKAFWLNDLNQQTQYYLYAYMLLSFLPFFSYLIMVLSNRTAQTHFTKYNLYLFIVQFSLFYTGLQLLIYSIAVNKWWSIIIPIILFLCMIIIRYSTFIFSLYKTIAIVTLLVITSIVQLKFSSPLGILLSLFLCFGMFCLIIF
jgi:hypothetical protein